MSISYFIFYVLVTFIYSWKFLLQCRVLYNQQLQTDMTYVEWKVDKLNLHRVLKSEMKIRIWIATAKKKKHSNSTVQAFIWNVDNWCIYGTRHVIKIFFRKLPSKSVECRPTLVLPHMFTFLWIFLSQSVDISKRTFIYHGPNYLKS